MSSGLFLTINKFQVQLTMVCERTLFFIGCTWAFFLHFLKKIVRQNMQLFISICFFFNQEFHSIDRNIALLVVHFLS